LTIPEQADWLAVTEEDWLLKVVIQRPNKLNAMTVDMVERMVDAVRRFEAEPKLRVFLLTARGPYFSAGMDISGGRPTYDGSSLEARRDYRNIPIQRLGDLIETVEKPVVVAHQGPCLGGSLEISLCCDFRLASSAATYGLPEIRIGVLPGSGGTSRLTRMAGPHWTRWLALAGETVDAERARAIGFVHDVYPAEEFDARVQAFCEKLNALPPEAVAVSKLAIELATDLERGQARNVERLANSILFVGKERQERVAAFLNRKKPSEEKS